MSQRGMLHEALLSQSKEELYKENLNSHFGELAQDTRTMEYYEA